MLVCGGRDYDNASFLFAALDAINTLDGGVDCVIHGGARGADRLAGDWADYHHIPQRAFTAQWVKYGRAAGPRRNQEMLDQGKPDVVIVFPGGRGTVDMVRRARVAGVRVIETVEPSAKEPKG
jgi:hypothetical protein